MKLAYRESDMTESIDTLITFFQNSLVSINETTEDALMEAGKVVAREQKRILNKAVFKRDKKSHVYKTKGHELSDLIKVWHKKLHSREWILSGFDGQTLEKYPELIEIEFGRPAIARGEEVGKSVDTLGRAVGDFPEAATVMPIRVGAELAKEEAFEKFKEKMFQAVQKDWKGG